MGRMQSHFLFFISFFISGIGVIRGRSPLFWLRLSEARPRAGNLVVRSIAEARIRRKEWQAGSSTEGTHSDGSAAGSLPYGACSGIRNPLISVSEWGDDGCEFGKPSKCSVRTNQSRCEPGMARIRQQECIL